MLIDRTHWRWFIVTVVIAVASVGIYLLFYGQSTSGLTGGTTVGLWYGVVGAALMIYAGMLSFLRRVPGWWWLGARKTWLRGHIWLGTLSAVFILCHSGFRWGGFLTTFLWIVLLVALATGLLGLYLQWYIPRQMTRSIPSEVPYGQIPHVCRRLLQQADSLTTQIRKDNGLPEKYQSSLCTFFDEQVLPFLRPQYDSSSELANALRAVQLFDHFRREPELKGVHDKLDTLQEYCEQRRQIGEQERMHHLLHGWLLIHIPCAVMLYVLGTIHAVMALRY